ncbi:MAG: TolC family protein [Bacteroidales bacterium]|nr:TolC family protein [Bacteroidales bacterium]
MTLKKSCIIMNVFKNKLTINIFLLRLIYFITAFLVLFCLSSIAQEDLSLADAIEKGLENNYQIRIYNENVEIAKNNNSWGTVGKFPSITLGLNQSNRYDNTPGKINPDERDEYYTNSIYPYINLGWTLFSGFAINISKQKLQALEQLSEGNAAIIVENTIQGIILAYYKILLEREKLKVLVEVKKLSGDRYNYVMARKELGSVVTYDVLQAKNSYLSDSSNYLLQELNVKYALLNLYLLLGEDSNIQYNLSDEFKIIEYDFMLNDLLDKMKTENKTLRNQYINQEILKKEISYQKSSLYPTIALNAGFDNFNFRIKYKNVPVSYSNNYDYYANFSLSFNLFNGGNTKRAIQNAKIEERVGELTIAEMKQSLSNILINYFELYSIKKQLYEVAIANQESASLNLQISNEKFKSGAINSFNYRDVQLIYLNAAIGKLEAIYNLIDTQTELMRITGSIISEY